MVNGLLLKLEVIGDDLRYMPLNLKAYKRRPDWVAEIIAPDDKYGFKRSFLKGQIDYTEANRDGSRGVYCYYYLYSGRVYEVQEPKGRFNNHRYYCHIINGKVTELSKEEVEERLRNT